MKKTILLLLLVYGCNKELTPLQEIQSRIESTLKKDLNNPESFEFDSFTIIDTIYSKQAYNNVKNYYLDNKKHHNEMIVSYQRMVNKWRDYIKKYPKRKSEFEKKAKALEIYVDENKIGLKKALDEIKKVDSILSNKIDDNKISEIEGLYKFRTLNEYNAKVLKSYTVFLNDSLKIIDIQEQKSKQDLSK
jgi:hypothetical protein